MGLFRKMRAAFHDDWCGKCQSEMRVANKQLYALPGVMVGHYVPHEEPEYYKNRLTKVSKKADIPTGMYACGIHTYRCPQCGHQAVKVTVFLPVRDDEKVEQVLYFDNGELDDFVWE